MSTELATIIADCRRRVDMKTNQFWTDDDFTSEINKSLAQLDMLLISKFNDYKLTPVLVNCTAGTNTIALPSDFLKFRGLDLVFSPNNADGYIPCEPFNFKKRNISPFPTMLGNIATPYAIQYRLQGATITLLPASTAANYTYRLWYTPDYVPLVNSTDTLQAYMDSQAWYEFAVCDVCAKCLAAQDLNPSTFMSQKEELREMIVKLSAPNRDAAEPTFITDTRGDWSGNGWGW